MRAIICSIVLLMFVNCSAQDLLTLREVFDYNIGDVFQYVDDAYPQYNKETIKILSKSYSIDEDTLVYIASSQLYYTLPEIDSLISEIDTIQFIYTNLDSSIFEYNPEYKYDSLIKELVEHLQSEYLSVSQILDLQ